MGDSVRQLSDINWRQETTTKDTRKAQVSLWLIISNYGIRKLSRENVDGIIIQCA